MIHASVELIEAMRGAAPEPEAYQSSACGSAGGLFVWGWDAANNPDGSSYGGLMRERAAESCDLTKVDCPACLKLMRDAIPPVRWDWLEERGLAPKLGAT